MAAGRCADPQASTAMGRVTLTTAGARAYNSRYTTTCRVSALNSGQTLLHSFTVLPTWTVPRRRYRSRCKAPMMGRQRISTVRPRERPGTATFTRYAGAVVIACARDDRRHRPCQHRVDDGDADQPSRRGGVRRPVDERGGCRSCGGGLLRQLRFGGDRRAVDQRLCEQGEQSTNSILRGVQYNNTENQAESSTRSAWIVQFTVSDGDVSSVGDHCDDHGRLCE